jgi:hypothetical protein
MEGGRPVVIANAEGGRTTSSVVAHTKTGDRLVALKEFQRPGFLKKSGFWANSGCANHLELL